MPTKIVIKKNTYFDSVSLMSVSTKANKLPGVEQAFVAMATEMNKGVLKNLGLLTPELAEAKNGDLMIVIKGDAANDETLAAIEALFTRKESGGTHEARYATIASAKTHRPESNLAVISVNGTFAAREARQALENTLLSLSLNVPEDGNEAAWLHAREAEFAQWQEKQTQHGALLERINALKPLLDTLPETNGEEAEPAIPDGWRDVHDECVSLQSQLTAHQQQEKLEQERLLQSQAQFTAALSASCFADRDAFLAALLDDDAIRRLEQLKQLLESQIQQAAALSGQANQQLHSHLALRPEGLNADAPTLQTQLQQLAQRLRENTTHQGEIRQQLKQDSDNRQHQLALMQQIEEAAREADDWGYLNALIGSSTGDKFRKFAQGLTLDNLVWLANQQLNRLHGRYLLQRKASDALELEVVDTWQADAVRDTRTLSGGESFLVSLALALALSDLVSHKTRIDSLFLDEGFGTLDSETLDTALDALDALNATGKTIGVISHVEAMKERIPVQIKVKKINGLGYSRLDKVFAVE